MGNLCGCSKDTIYTYESGNGHPHHTLMAKLSKALDVNIDYFGDDYYSFVLSKNYKKTLTDFRKNNKDIINRNGEISYYHYLKWEKGKILTRTSFKKLKGFGLKNGLHISPVSLYK